MRRSDLGRRVTEHGHFGTGSLLLRGVYSLFRSVSKCVEGTDLSRRVTEHAHFGSVKWCMDIFIFDFQKIEIETISSKFNYSQR